MAYAYNKLRETASAEPMIPLSELDDARRSSGVFRLYGHDAVERVWFVKQAQALGLELG